MTSPELLPEIAAASQAEAKKGAPRAFFLTHMKYVYEKETPAAPSWLNQAYQKTAEGICMMIRNRTLGAIPHLGVVLAAEEFQRAGFEVEIGNLLDEEDLLRAQRGDYDLLGVSLMASDKDLVLDNIRAGRFRPDRTVFGGYGAELLDQHRDEFPGLSIVAGEVEGLGEEIGRDVTNGGLKPKYERQEPFLWSEMGKDEYLEVCRAVRKFELVRDSALQVYELGRGCGYGCGFCPTAGMAPRWKPEGHAIAELSQAKPGVVFFADQNLLAYPREHLLKVFEEFNKKRNAFWIGEGTIVDAAFLDKSDPNSWDDELMWALGKKSLGLLFGLEDFSKPVPGAGRKMRVLQDNLGQIVQKTRENRLPAFASTMWGTDSQTFPGSFQEAVTGVEEHGLTILTHLATPEEGTPWYEIVRREGRLEEYSTMEMDFKYHAIHRPRHMSREQLFAGFTWFHERVFSPGAIAKRFRQNFRTAGAKYALGLMGVELNGLAETRVLRQMYGEETDRWSEKLEDF